MMIEQTKACVTFGSEKIGSFETEIIQSIEP
jgi:hypothetical protein